MDNRYLDTTLLIDNNHPATVQLVRGNSGSAWRSMIKSAQRITLQNDIVFGHNESDDIPASRVLQDEYGQWNIKSTLLIALLRRVGIPCRFHGITIDRRLQQVGIMHSCCFLMSTRRW